MCVWYTLILLNEFIFQNATFSGADDTELILEIIYMLLTLKLSPREMSDKPQWPDK